MHDFFSFIFSRLFLCFIIIAAMGAAIIFLCFYIPSLMPAAIAVACAYIISCATALVIFNGNAPADFKCAYLALISALPVVGCALYAFISLGRERRERQLKSLSPPIDAGACEYFPDGAAYLQALTREISAAEKSVYLEYYIIAKGKIFDGVYAELTSALSRGVRVKLMCDGLGSALRLPKGKFRQLKRAGAEIKIFHKLFPFPLSRLNFRDHRKLAVIDGRVAFIGGVNIADEYANLTSPHGYWKDTGVAVRGDAAAAFGENFMRFFGGGECAPPEGKSGSCVPVCDSPEEAGSLCEDALAAMIYSAGERVLVFTPYLCPGGKLKDALTFCAARGVRTEIIIPHVPDKRLPFEITKTFAEELMRGGVSVYEFTPGFMHAKSVVCDGCALLGSYNLDFRSMRLNHECGALFYGEVADRIAGDFDCTLKLCKKLKPERARPLKRVFRSVLKLFSPLV